MADSSVGETAFNFGTFGNDIVTDTSIKTVYIFISIKIIKKHICFENTHVIFLSRFTEKLSSAQATFETNPPMTLR